MAISGIKYLQPVTLLAYGSQTHLSRQCHVQLLYMAALQLKKQGRHGIVCVLLFLKCSTKLFSGNIFIRNKY